MAERQAALSLRALEDAYEIVGELRGSRIAHKYLATRRDDGANVVIAVHTAPPGGESNELSHLAADARLLSGLEHPALAPVLDARWLGDGILAVVTARLQGTTLAELLRARGRDAFTNPRAALVLQEVWGVLDWARSSGVVHRGVTPDDVYFEPSTERAKIILGPTRVPVVGTTDASGDRRTIGALAWAMLTGTPFSNEKATKSLGELVPDLAIRLIDATETMAYGARNPSDEPDVATFIGIVAAGDVLKQAEVELAAMKEQYEEQHRLALAACENQRVETERRAAEQAELLARERADFEGTMSDHQEQLASVRDELRKRTASVEQRIAEFESKRAKINRLRAEQQARVTAAQHARENEAAKRRAENGGREPLPELKEPEDIRTLVGAPRRPLLAQRDDKPSGWWNKRWVMPAAAAGVLLIIATAAGGIFYYRQRGDALPRRVTIQRPAPPPRAAGAEVAPGALTVPLPVNPDSGAPIAPVTGPPSIEAPALAHPEMPRPTNDVTGAAPPTAPSRDTSARSDSISMRTDSVLRGDAARGYDSVVVKRGVPFRVRADSIGRVPPRR
jgi:hypothetical protein